MSDNSSNKSTARKSKAPGMSTQSKAAAGEQRRVASNDAKNSVPDQVPAQTIRGKGEKDTPKEEATDSATSDQSNDSEASFQVVTRRRKTKTRQPQASSTEFVFPDAVRSDKSAPMSKPRGFNKPLGPPPGLSRQTSHKPPSNMSQPPAAAQLPRRSISLVSVPWGSLSDHKETAGMETGNISSTVNAPATMTKKCPWANIPTKPAISSEPVWPVAPPSCKPSTSTSGDVSDMSSEKEYDKRPRSRQSSGSDLKQDAEPLPQTMGTRRKSRQIVEALKPLMTEAPVAELVHSPTVEQVTKALQNVDIPEKLIPLPIRKKGKTIPSYESPHVLKVMTIEVNYLPLKINNPKLNLYHYDVAFIPDKPLFLLRPALEQMRQKYFKDRYPAFDGRKNMYVAGRPLTFPKGDTLRDTVEVMNEDNAGQKKSFDIAIKCVNANLNMAELIKYTKTGITGDIPQSVIQATDIALRSGLTSAFTTVGRSFFADPRALDVAKIHDLSGGMEIWPGIYQSAVMAWKPYVNVDVANKAFPKEQQILRYMKETLMCSEDDFRHGLHSHVKEKLQYFLKGLKIEYRMPSSNPNEINKRNYKIVGLGQDAENERFQPDGDTPPVIVYDYYKSVKNYTITYPKLPLLIVGTKGALIPIERCSIISNQILQRKLDEKQTSNMVKAAARPTDERKITIIKNICHARYSRNPTLKEFEIEVGTEFEKVKGVVLNPPQIAYCKLKGNPLKWTYQCGYISMSSVNEIRLALAENPRTANESQYFIGDHLKPCFHQSTAAVRDGVWKMENKDQFPIGSKLYHWGILALDSRMDHAKVTQLAKSLIQEGPKKGIAIQPPSKMERLRERITEDIIHNKLLEFGKAGLTMVLVIMTSNAECYGMVKRASELRSGILTQCLKIKTVDLASGVRMSTIHNILLKINTKLHGVNHYIPAIARPEVLQGAVMIAGADVTHPASDSRANTPSIAAVTASQDSYGFQYNMIYRLQHSKQEMIEDLANIMKTQLELYKQNTGSFPSKILFFRDGISEGQFQTVLYVELTAIKRGCAMAAPSATIGITLVVVQKRHHTRFFPHKKDGDGRNNNVPAGTLVDTVITHPTEIDFYLVSHQSIQGTARPTKYHLLWDENDIPEFELQRVTFYLCHLFSRCTRAVSYPAPTYYAHLAAFRARAWWDREDINMSKLSEEQDIKGRINLEILNKYPMFFV